MRFPFSPKRHNVRSVPPSSPSCTATIHTLPIAWFFLDTNGVAVLLFILTVATFDIGITRQLQLQTPRVLIRQGENGEEA